MVNRLIGFFVFSLFPTFSWALNQVTASVDKNPVFENEPFVLEVVADDSVSTSAFSSAPLLKLGFIVGSTQISTHRSISNGGVVKRTTWRTELRIARPGTYTIPTFDVEGHLTQPINIKVESARQNTKPDTDRDVFLTAELSDNSAYPQQQLVYTLKVYLATELQRATLSDPVLEGAEIRQLGKDKESTELINGRRYRIIERRYALSAAKSGSFVIDSPIFKGQVLNRDRRGGYYSVPVNVQADPITLRVKPIPDNFPGQWLPGVVASLHEEWQPEVTQITVGEPITRILTFSIAGTNHSQLPSLSGNYPSNIRIYPDQVDNQTYVKNQLLVAQRVEAEALIPTEEGEITLPEIRIPWWNTEQERLEYATLPARILTVLPAQQGTTTTPQAQSIQLEASPSLFWRNAAFLIFGIWLSTLAVWYWQHKRTPKPEVERTPKGNMQTGNSWKQLEHALAINDTQQVLSNLPAWLLEYYQVNSITQLAGRLDDQTHAELQEAYNQLTAARYFSKANNQWNGTNLSQILKKMNSKFEQGAENSLPPLYPNKI